MLEAIVPLAVVFVILLILSFFVGIVWGLVLIFRRMHTLECMDCARTWRSLTKTNCVACQSSATRIVPPPKPPSIPIRSKA